jgi:hypothetical protein
MKQNRGVITFGIIEIAIGSVTFFAVITSFILGKSAKPLEVLVFVLTTATISLSLGIGILRRSLTSYHLLLFFAAVIILSKILIFAKIISLSGALETAVPSSFKNIISVIYHSVLIVYFRHGKVREYFRERRDVLFALSWPSFKRKLT